MVITSFLHYNIYYLLSQWYLLRSIGKRDNIKKMEG